MEQSPNLALPYIAPAQAQKHVTHNEAIRTLDTLVQLAVASRTVAAPPATPADGIRHIVPTGAGGDWSGHDLAIAAFQDGAWTFLDPRAGWLAWVSDEAVLLVHDGAGWTPAADGASVNPAPLIGVNTTADATNRLAVAADATLLSHAGAGHQVKINKAAAGDTASQIFQTAFGGRAEIGLTGDDDLHVKVSPDGGTWHEAIVIDRTSGAVSLPNTAAGVGGGGGGNGGGSVGPEAGIWRTTRDPGVGWISHPGTSLASVGAITNATFVPLRIGAAGVHDTMNVFCQVAAPGESVRIALYAAAPDRLIGPLAADFGTASLGTTGMKTLTTAPVTLAAGLYYALLQVSGGSPSFRGGTAAIDSGAGILSSIIQAAGIGRIVYLGYGDPWPGDMTAFAIGAGPEQIQLIGGFFCPAVLLR